MNGYVNLDISRELKRIRSDSPAGFETFYALIHGRIPPAHTREWIEKVYEARKNGRGIVIEAFRGSTKTTTMMTFVAYRMGLEPQRANLLIQVGDDIARNNAAQIADIIEHNRFWKVCFPNVVPDKNLGWGADGYEIMDNSMQYDEWRRKNARRKDPSLVGLGRTSRAIIGKHPDGVLIVDDIDDENTTSSERERTKTHKILTGTIFPTMTPETWSIIVGTPWTTNDTLAYVKSTGEYDHAYTPIKKGDKLAWPEVFNDEVIEKQRKKVGELEFARMFMLDLEKAKGLNLKMEWLHQYPHKDIDPTWPVVIGVDYASTMDKLKDRKRDYFALAVGRCLPGGGVVLVDGVREHVSQGEAVQLTQAWAATYPTTQLVVVETHGVGEQFFSLLLRNTALPLHKATTADKIHSNPSGKNKGDRFERQMAPVFQMSRAWITDKDSKFITAFKNEWGEWPNGEHDDTLDAVFYMIYGAILVGALAPNTQTMTPKTWYGPPKPSINPWASLGKRHA